MVGGEGALPGIFAGGAGGLTMYNGVYDKEQFAYLYGVLEKWLSLKIEGGSLAERLLENSINAVAIYGMRGLGEMVYRDIENSGVEVRCFIDKRAGEYPEGYHGKKVFSIAQAKENLADAFILVTPEFYFREIFQSLLGAGINMERIISLAMVLQ